MSERLNFKEYFYEPIKSGLKTSTIRRLSNLKEGDCVETNFIQDPHSLYLKITKVNRIRFDEIDNIIAEKEGYRHSSLLKEELKRIYGSKLDNADLFYQIEFELE